MQDLREDDYLFSSLKFTSSVLLVMAFHYRFGLQCGGVCDLYADRDCSTSLTLVLSPEKQSKRVAESGMFLLREICV